VSQRRFFFGGAAVAVEAGVEDEVDGAAAAEVPSEVGSLRQAARDSDGDSSE
jgi:hypothetical protein